MTLGAAVLIYILPLKSQHFCCKFLLVFALVCGVNYDIDTTFYANKTSQMYVYINVNAKEDIAKEGTWYTYIITFIELKKSEHDKSFFAYSILVDPTNFVPPNCQRLEWNTQGLVFWFVIVMLTARRIGNWVC